MASAAAVDLLDQILVALPRQLPALRSAPSTASVMTAILAARYNQWTSAAVGGSLLIV
jgi:hypothetical protein